MHILLCFIYNANKFKIGLVGLTQLLNFLTKVIGLMHSFIQISYSIGNKYYWYHGHDTVLQIQFWRSEKCGVPFLPATMTKTNSTSLGLIYGSNKSDLKSYLCLIGACAKNLKKQLYKKCKKELKINTIP